MRAILAATQSLLAVIALIGYFANGAQSHLSFHSGETIDLQMCGSSEGRSVTLDIKGEPAEFHEDACCGDCLVGAAPLPGAVQFITPIRPTTVQRAEHLASLISPRSPLWPGAPPHGPPTPHSV